MNSTELVKEYLRGTAETMQLATVSSGKPWIASVYFVCDENLNVYWLSWPERRHSREIERHSSVAAAIVIKSDKPVVGLQLEGEAREVHDVKVVEEVMLRYKIKYAAGQDFLKNFIKGTNRHALYRLTPSSIQLFDEVHFPGQSPLHIEPKSVHIR